MGAYYLRPPDERAIFSHSDFLCNGTCSVIGASITYWVHKRKRSEKSAQVNIYLQVFDLNFINNYSEQLLRLITQNK